MAELLGAVAAAAQLAQLSAQILSSGYYAFLSKAAKTPIEALDSFVEVDRQRVANLAKRLAWPLREKEVADALQRLSRLRGIISTAIEASSSSTLPYRNHADEVA
ncbi:hypothetical protein B0I37DRAFT_404367 [Chaetomium sp. MPI-CAGE-AT-0009]|nr:hypothetical protein B0I37DRAFT_404367 [Chaetomium sp. MPI-CAGE-AT-0009]